MFIDCQVFQGIDFKNGEPSLGMNTEDYIKGVPYQILLKIFLLTGEKYYCNHNVKYVIMIKEVLWSEPKSS